MEMREDITGLKTTVDVIAKDQALGVGMTGRGDTAGKERKTGRGERSRAEAIQVTVHIATRHGRGAGRAAS